MASGQASSVCRRRRLPWRPSEKVSGRIFRRVEDHALIPRGRIGKIELLGRGRRVDSNIGVVNGGASRPELEASDVSRAIERHAHDEIPEDVTRAGWKHVLRQRDDQVRRSPRPRAIAPRTRRPYLSRPSGAPASHPSRDQRFLFARESPVAHERRRIG